MPFVQEKRITDGTSSSVHLFSTVAMVHVPLGKRALSALVNKLAIW
jgi:hypothetical protein